MRKNLTRGFTLIELLVVIAIIGILASIVLVSLNSARSKGRDAARVVSLREMGKAALLIDTDPAAPFVGCITDNADVTTCTTPSLLAYKDPSTPGTLCTPTSTATCQYIVSGSNGTVDQASTPKVPNSQNFQFCGYLEIGLNGGGNGMYSVSSATSSVAVGCK